MVSQGLQKKRSDAHVAEDLVQIGYMPCYFETPYEEIKYLKQLLEIDDQLPMLIINLGC